MTTTQLGDLTITPISDGTISFVATEVFSTTTDADWANHADLVDSTGNLNFDIGTYLIRSGSRTVLIDAGVGDIQRGTINGGQLITNLAAAGVTPDDIDTVVFTHLHFDHMGWAARKAGDTYAAVFPNANYRAHADELTYHYSTNNPAHERFTVIAVGFENRLETFADGDTIAPGITMRHTPGHTPGSSMVIMSSQGQRAILLGDAVHCPAQIQHPEWGLIFDVDPTAARHVREAVAREIDGETLVGAAHFPDLKFGRLISSGTTRIWSPVA